MFCNALIPVLISTRTATQQTNYLSSNHPHNIKLQLWYCCDTASTVKLPPWSKYCWVTEIQFPAVEGSGVAVAEKSQTKREMELSAGSSKSRGKAYKPNAARKLECVFLFCVAAAESDALSDSLRQPAIHLALKLLTQRQSPPRWQTWRRTRPCGDLWRPWWAAWCCAGRSNGHSGLIGGRGKKNTKSQAPDNTAL